MWNNLAVFVTIEIALLTMPHLNHSVIGQENPNRVLPPMFFRPGSSTKRITTTTPDPFQPQDPLPKDKPKEKPKGTKPSSQKPGKNKVLHDCHCRKKSESQEEAEMKEYLEWMEQNSRANEYRFSVAQVPHKPGEGQPILTTTPEVPIVTTTVPETTTIMPEVTTTTPLTTTTLSPTTTDIPTTVFTPLATTTGETLNETNVGGSGVDDENYTWPTSAYVFEKDSGEEARTCFCKQRKTMIKNKSH